MFRLVRAPYRISILGGGTDIVGKGAALSFAIDKYCYVTVMDRHDDKIVCSYSDLEIVDSVDDLNHDIARETLKLFNIEHGVEIHSLSDIPTRGCGLGTSSAFAVALVQAFNPQLHRSEVANLAFIIERERCGKNCGNQDHYASAFGGFNKLQFRGQYTIVENLDVYEPSLHGFQLHKASGFRSNTDILSHYAITDDDIADMETLVEEAYLCVTERVIPEWGAYLSRNWKIKKQWNPAIVTEKLDSVIGADAKLCGAGGTGYILSYHKSYDDLEELEFNEDRTGVTVLYEAGGIR